MSFKSAPIFEIVRLIDLQQPGESGFCMFVDAGSESRLIPELQEELAVQNAGSLGVVNVSDETVPGLN